jgi:orotate phosphoribosyltransferase
MGFLEITYYCDNRLILSFPPIRNYVRDEFSKHIENQFGKPDVIAGVATGAIGIGILVESLGVPFVYVRPEAKTQASKPSRGSCKRDKM